MPLVKQLRALTSAPSLYFAFFWFLVYAQYYFFWVSRRPIFHYKESKFNRDIVKHLKILHRRYFPSLFFFNGWLHLILYVIRSTKAKKLVSSTKDRAALFEHEELELRDGGRVALEWRRPVLGLNKQTGGPKLVMLLNPTLTGACGEFNMIDMTNYVVQQNDGVQAVVLHRRGHEVALRTPRFHMFGSTDDLQQVVEHICRKVKNCRIALVGYSAGSALTGRMAGDVGQLIGRTRAEIEEGIATKFKHNRVAHAALAVDPRATPCSWRGGTDVPPQQLKFWSPVIGVVSVSPAYTLSDGLERCQALLGRRLVEGCKKCWLLSDRNSTEMLKRHNSEAFEKCMNANNMLEFLLASAPFTEFPNVDELMANMDPVVQVR